MTGYVQILPCSSSHAAARAVDLDPQRFQRFTSVCKRDAECYEESLGWLVGKDMSGVLAVLLRRAGVPCRVDPTLEALDARARDEWTFIDLLALSEPLSGDSVYQLGAVLLEIKAASRDHLVRFDRHTLTLARVAVERLRVIAGTRFAFFRAELDVMEQDLRWALAQHEPTRPAPPARRPAPTRGEPT